MRSRPNWTSLLSVTFRSQWTRDLRRDTGNPFPHFKYSNTHDTCCFIAIRLTPFVDSLIRLKHNYSRARLVPGLVPTPPSSLTPRQEVTHIELRNLGRSCSLFRAGSGIHQDLKIRFSARQLCYKYKEGATPVSNLNFVKKTP